MRRICFLLVFLQTTLALQSKSPYTGYQIYETAPLDASSVLKLAPLMTSSKVDMLARPREGRPAKIMTSPDHVTELKEQLTQILGVEPVLLVENVQDVVDRERAEIEYIRSIESKASNLTLDRFMDFDEIQAYLLEVVEKYPNIASIIEIGRSYYGDPLRVLKLSKGGNKPAYFSDSGLHACEWAGPPVTLYSIQQLTENLENDYLLDLVDFYFLAVANPDGYKHAWDHFRFWRKTRSPNDATNCIGTDPNRNWDWHWGEDGNYDPCSYQYPGNIPFSEPETTAISQFISDNKQITAFTSIHSFGQYIIYPWGNTLDLPPNSDQLKRVGDAAAAALYAVNGTEYQVGSISNLLYVGYGGNNDWVMGVANIEQSITIELPEGGVTGFDLPPERIRPVAQETWQAVKVLAIQISNKPATRP